MTVGNRFSAGASRRAFHPGAGFTLIELLVVIVIIAVLAAILFPVLVQARDKSRATVALSNARQIGMAITLYVQDWDEGLPLNNHSAGASWIETLQPYTKTFLLNRAPGDRSVNWERPLPGQTAIRRSSYATNAYLTPGGGFPSLVSITSPSQCVYVAEYKENKTGDHLHPQCWPPTGCFSRRRTVLIDPRSEIETERYQGGAHYVFADGHAKWHRFEQTFRPGAVNWYYPGAGAPGSGSSGH